MEKALPVTYPAIDAYNNIANVLSIIQGDDRVAEWLHSHFIQLCHDKSFEDGFTLSFYAPYLIKTCPWLDTQIVHKRIVEKGWDDITRFLIDCIDSGCYVILLVDQFYIPNSVYYQKSHRPHELFVSGYHLGNEEFYISDNFASGKYKRLACSFEDMRTAYNKLSPEIELNYNNYNGMMFVLSKKELAEPIPFHPQLVVHQLENYLHAKDSSAADQTLYAHNKPDCSYGLQCYSNLIRYVGHVCDCHEYLDIRPFHVIYLHKKQMYSRIEFMRTKVDLLSAFRPFAPIVLEEEQTAYFSMEHPSYYMLLVPYILEEKRSEVPSITHADGTGRVQTVSKPINPKLHRLLSSFQRLTGTPLLLNTSFNDNGEPIVETPTDAIRCFLNIDLDGLVLDKWLIRKKKRG